MYNNAHLLGFWEVSVNHLDLINQKIIAWNLTTGQIRAIENWFNFNNGSQ